MQNKVSEFRSKYNLNKNKEICYMDLVTEVGELGKEIIKGTNYGVKDFELTANTKSELGDCLFSLLSLADCLDINIKEALNEVIDKYEKRFLEKGNIGS